jgi:hypothetical protein
MEVNKRQEIFETERVPTGRRREFGCIHFRFICAPANAGYEAAIRDIEALASVVCGATMWSFPPQLLGSLVTKMKEEETEWHQ